MPRGKAQLKSTPPPTKKRSAIAATNTDIADRFDAVRDALLDIRDKYEAEFMLMAAHDDRCTLGIDLQKLIDAFGDKTTRARIRKQLAPPKQKTLGAKAS